MYSSAKLKALTEATEKLLKESKGVDDVDLARHKKELERYDLKATEWKTKIMDNNDHDYFSELLSKYLQDLADR
jgi:hypothetical protein